MTFFIDSIRGFIRGRQDIAANVHVTHSVAHGRRATRVSIDHSIPSPGAGRRARWRITTRAQQLSTQQFDRDVCSVINVASQVRGRSIYCLDLVRQEVLSAVAYHLDDDATVPVLATAFAFRTDGDDTLYRESLASVILIKGYLHVIGDKDGRGTDIGYDAGGALEIQVATQALGFRRAAVPKGFRPGGSYLSQGPFEERNEA